MCRARLSRTLYNSPSALPPCPCPPRARAMSPWPHFALTFVLSIACFPPRLRAAMTIVQSTDPAIDYIGFWEPVKQNSTTAYVISNTTGSKAVYTFTGQSIWHNEGGSRTQSGAIQGPKYQCLESSSPVNRPVLHRCRSTASMVTHQRSIPLPETSPMPCITCSSTRLAYMHRDSIRLRSSTSATNSLSDISKSR